MILIWTTRETLRLDLLALKKCVFKNTKRDTQFKCVFRFNCPLTLDFETVW